MVENFAYMIYPAEPNCKFLNGGKRAEVECKRPTAKASLWNFVIDI
jgi:hypothetical protein